MNQRIGFGAALVLVVVSLCSPASCARSSPLDALPVFEGNIVAQKTLSWSPKCFVSSSATVSIADTSALITLHVADPSGFTCTDIYVLATSRRFIFEPVIIRGTHTISIDSFKDDAEKKDIQENGVRVFYFKDGVTTSMIDLFNLYEMYFGTGEYGRKLAREFLKEKAGMVFPMRKNVLLPIDESLVEDGDILLLMKMCGVEPIEFWVSGSHAGHVCMAIHDRNGHVIVIETTNPDGTIYDIPPPFGVRRTLWKDWLYLYQKAGYSATWLKLTPELRKKFNATRALEYFEQHEGMPFGQTSFFSPALDTLHGNLPPPYSLDSITTIMTMVGYIVPNVSKVNMVYGLNHRLQEYYGYESKCADLPCVMEVADSLHTTVPDLMILPELDKWLYPIYPDGRLGPSMVCVGFATHVMKEAGVFPLDIMDQINIAEWTPKDLYQLKIFDDKWDRPTDCKKESSLPYCQLFGDYFIDLPGFNTLSLYPHMNERCQALPPDYTRTPSDC